MLRISAMPFVFSNDEQTRFYICIETHSLAVLYKAFADVIDVTPWRWRLYVGWSERFESCGAPSRDHTVRTSPNCSVEQSALSKSTVRIHTCGMFPTIEYSRCNEDRIQSLTNVLM